MGCGSSSTRDVNNLNNKKETGSRKAKQSPEEIVNQTITMSNIKDVRTSKKNRKGKASKKLSNEPIKVINESALSITKYFKDQISYDDESSPYTDELFPPNENSILGLDENGNPTELTQSRIKEKKLKVEEIVWLRAGEIFESGEFVLFEESISIDDINQGGIGNCYFMSALSSLAETPQLIVEVFRDLKKKENGYYEVVMRIDGQWNVIILDDYFPCSKTSKKPYFAKPNGNEIWVMLLEKAWAKINGGYQNIIAGQPYDVLSCLTNFACDQFYHTGDNFKKEDFWQKLLISSGNEDIITANSMHDDKIKEVGIVAGHAFSIFEAKEGLVKNKKVRLIKIRNPWGYKEWTGKWSDGSKEWTKEAISVFGNQEKKDDGCFWIEYDDYLKYFLCTGFCYVKSPLITKSILIEKDTSSNKQVVELSVYEEVELTIIIFTPSWRFNRELKNPCCLQINSILIKKSNSDDEDAGGSEGNKYENAFEYIESSSTAMGNCVLKATVMPGKYLLISHINFDAALNEKVVNDYYSYTINIGANEFIDADYKGCDSDSDILTKVALSGFYKKKYSGEIKKKKISVYNENTTGNTSYGSTFIYNNTESDVNYSIDTKHIVNFDLDRIESNITIPSHSSYLIMSYRKVFYSAFRFSLITKETEDEGTRYENEQLDYFIENHEIPDSEEPLVSGFIFMKVDMDFNKFCEKIDNKEILEKYYQSRYPDLMRDINALDVLDDGVPVRFIDKYIFSDESYFFGEAQEENQSIFHGRGIYYWPHSDNYFVGYFENGTMKGPGTITYASGVKIKINYDNGMMNGEGLYYAKDSNEPLKILYENNQFIKWIN